MSATDLPERIVTKYDRYGGKHCFHIINVTLLMIDYMKTVLLKKIVSLHIPKWPLEASKSRLTLHFLQQLPTLKKYVT